MRPPVTLPCVLLYHRLPDGLWHFDWLLQRPVAADSPPGDATGLIGFRLTARPDASACLAFDAERTPDHRAAYLTYQGPVSNDRGHVRRLARGRCRWGEPQQSPDLDHGFTVGCRWDGSGLFARVLTGLPVEPGSPNWRFSYQRTR